MKKILCVLLILVLAMSVACSFQKEEPTQPPTLAYTEEDYWQAKKEDDRFAAESIQAGFAPVTDAFIFEQSEVLDAWIGKYEYLEPIPEDYERDEHDGLVIGAIYEMRIYKEGSAFWAEIHARGYQQATAFKAAVMGDARTIRLYFYSYLSDNVFALETCYKGALMLKLERENDEIKTYWTRTICPFFSENELQGKEYFIKIE
jgi:hypothetical protein